MFVLISTLSELLSFLIQYVPEGSIYHKGIYTFQQALQELVCSCMTDDKLIKLQLNEFYRLWSVAFLPTALLAPFSSKRRRLWVPEQTAPIFISKGEKLVAKWQNSANSIRAHLIDRIRHTRPVYKSLTRLDKRLCYKSTQDRMCLNATVGQLELGEAVFVICNPHTICPMGLLIVWDHISPSLVVRLIKQDQK